MKVNINAAFLGYAREPHREILHTRPAAHVGVIGALPLNRVIEEIYGRPRRRLKIKILTIYRILRKFFRVFTQFSKWQKNT